MLKIKCDINQQYLKTVDLHFVKSEWFSLTWSCGSRQRDTTLSEWKFRLNNLAVKGLNKIHRIKNDRIHQNMDIIMIIGFYLRHYPPVFFLEKSAFFIHLEMGIAAAVLTSRKIKKMRVNLCAMVGLRGYIIHSWQPKQKHGAVRHLVYTGHFQ